MEDTSFYIEFVVKDSARFEVLQKVFNEFKDSKEKASIKEDNFYLEFFDDEAKSYFGWYSEEENLEWANKWIALPIEKRWNDPSLQRKWDFGSMIDAFKCGEYELISCEMISKDTARIKYNPWAYPYGGTGCMKALIESFGFEVTKDET